MLDVNDFVTERGGDVKKIKESQKARYASEELVDEVYQMYEDHRKSTLKSYTAAVIALSGF